ncbi:MAG: hypothetical protein R3E96_08795 [Planctomycetota bacterium]
MLAFVAACQSNGSAKQPELAALTCQSRFPVQYEGGVHVAEATVSTPVQGIGGGDPKAPQVTVSVQVIDLPAALLDQILPRTTDEALYGWCIESTAWRETIEPLLERGLASVIESPKLTLGMDPRGVQGGEVQILDRSAYIKGFQVDRTTQGQIVDPLIDVLDQGIGLFVAVAPAEGSNAYALHCTLTTQELAAKTQTRVRIAKGALPVEMEIPVVFREVLNGTATLPAGSMAVLPPLDRENGHRWITCLQVSPANP